jgi:hypothetical protein
VYCYSRCHNNNTLRGFWPLCLEMIEHLFIKQNRKVTICMLFGWWYFSVEQFYALWVSIYDCMCLLHCIFQLFLTRNLVMCMPIKVRKWWRDFKFISYNFQETVYVITNQCYVYRGPKRQYMAPRVYPLLTVYTNKNRVMPFIPTTSVRTCPRNGSWITFIWLSYKGKKRDPDGLKLGLVS